jgi:ketosteroid isomerase-like protein
VLPVDPTATARAVVERWVQAQNTGDFTAYGALYAQTFHGVRRSGKRMARFDRAGWLRDRARMFKKPIRVEVADVAVQPEAQGARVTFAQTFTTGSYRDVGPKRLTLVEEGGALRIAGEEMLAASRVPVARPGDVAYLHVIKEGVIVGSQPAEAWGAGPLQLLEHDDLSATVSRAVTVAALPADLAKIVGLRLRLFKERGPVCEATVTELRLLTRLLSDQLVDDEEGKPLTGQALANRAWKDGAGERLLIGQLQAASGDCTDAEWARDAALPVPEIRGVEPVEPAWADAARAASRALPAYRKLQADYDKYRNAPQIEQNPKPAALPDAWEQYVDGKETILSFEHEGRRYISVTFSVPPSCGAFGGSLWALFLVRGKTPATARFILQGDVEPDDADPVTPAHVVDVDGDGRPEMLIAHGIVRWRDDRLRDVDREAIPSHICPC